MKILDKIKRWYVKMSWQKDIKILLETYNYEIRPNMIQLISKKHNVSRAMVNIFALQQIRKIKNDKSSN